MPIYDARKIMGEMADPYERSGDRARFEHRIRCEALEAVEGTGMAIEEVALVLAKIAHDVRGSVRRRGEA